MATHDIFRSHGYNFLKLPLLRSNIDFFFRSQVNILRHFIYNMLISSLAECNFIHKNCGVYSLRPSQVNSLFLVILLAENLPSLQQKKNKGLKKKTSSQILVKDEILTFCFKWVPKNSHTQFMSCRKNIYTSGKDLFFIIP